MSNRIHRIGENAEPAQPETIEAIVASHAALMQVVGAILVKAGHLQRGTKVNSTTLMDHAREYLRDERPPVELELLAACLANLDIPDGELLNTALPKIREDTEVAKEWKRAARELIDRAREERDAP